MLNEGFLDNENNLRNEETKMIARLGLLGAALALVGTTTIASAAPTTLKLAYFGSTRSPTWREVMSPWADDVTRDSKGTIKIDKFPGGTLGRNPRVQVKLVLDGVTDLGFFVPSYTPGRFPDTQIMELPGIVNHSLESSIAIWRLYNQGLLRGFDKFKVLMLVTTDPYTIHTKNPVKRIADLKGLKLRAGGPVAGATMKALGAIPIGMPIPAVAQNISKGILDGSAVDWNVLYAFRIVDVARHHYMGLVGTVPIGILMNKAKWSALPAAAKAAFNKHSGEALARRHGISNAGVQKRLGAKTRKDPKHSIVDPDAAAQKQWDAIMKPVVSQWAKKHPNGQKLLQTLRNELANIRAGK